MLKLFNPAAFIPGKVTMVTVVDTPIVRASRKGTGRRIRLGDLVGTKGDKSIDALVNRLVSKPSRAA